MSPNKRYIGKLAPEQALELFHNMLEHMPVGVALFDGEFRMVAINQTALDMLDFPAELFSPQMPTLEDLLWFNARRGEYGPGVPETLVRERLALAAKREAHRFVRHRPDGMAIEVIGAPLPGGGFVSIYTDITERERATAQINEQALYLRSVLAHLPQGISVFGWTRWWPTPGATTGGWRCCSWTWTTSRASTTAWAMAWATNSCAPSPSGCALPCATATLWRAWAATSSLSC